MLNTAVHPVGAIKKPQREFADAPGGRYNVKP